MKKSGVKPGYLKAVRKPKALRGLMKDADKLTCSNGASSSRSKNSVMQVTDYRCIAQDVKVGRNVTLSQFINLYGCEVGNDTKIGAFVEIQKNAKVGNRCKISSHTFICEGVTIEDEVFVGHNVTFVNDSFPRATSRTGGLQTEQDWKVEVTLVKEVRRLDRGQPSCRMW